jgi:nucleoside-triphosphatase THEP1
MQNNPIALITGHIQTGKTTRLLQWTADSRHTAGLLTPVNTLGIRQFYNITNRTYFAMEAVGNEAALQVGRFSFSEAAFKTANGLLLDWLSQPHWQYLLIDEIGPLELNQQKGLYPVLQYLMDTDTLPCKVAIVVRQQCLAQLTQVLTGKNKEVQVFSAAAFIACARES